jgi:hypothetical protein
MTTDDLQRLLISALRPEWDTPRWLARRCGISELQAKILLRGLWEQARCDGKRSEGGWVYRAVPTA